MPAIDFDAERVYDDERFSAREVFRTDRSKVVCGYFEPGQFIPVHAPASDVVISVREGTGIVREGEDTHRVGPGDVVVVEAGKVRGIRADEDEAAVTDDEVIELYGEYWDARGFLIRMERRFSGFESDLDGETRSEVSEELGILRQELETVRPPWDVVGSVEALHDMLDEVAEA